MTSPIADMVEKMLAGGVAPDVIVLAVRTAEVAARANVVPLMSGGNPVDTAAEKRRAWDRDRKAALRASGGKSGGNPPDSPVDKDSALSFLETDSEKKSLKTERAARKNGAEIPPDWKPSEKHFREGAELALTSVEVSGMATDMRLWADANSHRAVARKSDWDKTFSAWMRREAPKRRNANGKRPHDTASRSDTIIAGVAAAYGFRDGAAPRPEREEIPSGRTELDL